ncbi:MAG: sugar transferase [Alphaproteobacteria bacterium]|nr:MAG: sugar transferase [Alphaproteobacteria bacterium]
MFDMDRAKRVFDFSLALAGLALTLPVLLGAMLAIWLQDGHNPIYWASRVGQGNRNFRMLKLRTMVPGTDRLGGRLAPDGDPRVTRVGAWLRARKIDELPQLLNVIRGEMSVVGPRPDLREGVDLYSGDELRLLEVRPGMTDFSSLLFFDEGRLLAEVRDPDACYRTVIRPLKRRLGLLYVERRTLAIDLRLAWLTVKRFAARQPALAQAGEMLAALDAETDLIAVFGDRVQTASLSGKLGTIRG